jgi:hypothetical protein
MRQFIGEDVLIRILGAVHKWGEGQGVDDLATLG